MPKFYTVDRARTAFPGANFSLKTDFSYESIWEVQDVYTKSDVIARVQQLYPNGLSTHGIQYLISHGLVIFENGTRKPLHVTHTTPMVEAIFELVRRCEFPNRPSRMQSMFGWCDLALAQEFNTSNGGTYTIYELESESAFVADQNLLYLGASVIGAYEMARKYWSGERSSNVRLEAVIPLPAVIGSDITSPPSEHRAVPLNSNVE